MRIAEATLPPRRLEAGHEETLGHETYFRAGMLPGLSDAARLHRSPAVQTRAELCGILRLRRTCGHVAGAPRKLTARAVESKRTASRRSHRVSQPAGKPGGWLQVGSVEVTFRKATMDREEPSRCPQAAGDGAEGHRARAGQRHRRRMDRLHHIYAESIRNLTPFSKHYFAAPAGVRRRAGLTVIHDGYVLKLFFATSAAYYGGGTSEAHESRRTISCTGRLRRAPRAAASSTSAAAGRTRASVSNARGFAPERRLRYALRAREVPDVNPSIQ